MDSLPHGVRQRLVCHYERNSVYTQTEKDLSDHPLICLAIHSITGGLLFFFTRLYATNKVLDSCCKCGKGFALGKTAALKNKF
jgi:hypothetical protein